MPDKAMASGTRHIAGAVALLCAFLIIVPLISGCSQQQQTPNSPSSAQPAAVMAAQVAETPTTPASDVSTPSAESPTVSPDATSTTAVEAVPPVTSTVEAAVTATVEEGTPTPRPTVSGPPPSDPLALLGVFQFVTPGNQVVKSDPLDLDGKDPKRVLLTISDSRLGSVVPITEEATSALGVLFFDTRYNEWDLAWRSDPISGTAHPLPPVTLPGGFNGGDLLRTGDPILALRTTTLDGAAHLALYRYNKADGTATQLKMVPAGGGAEQPALFTADLDVNVADLDDDGIYEVVADNVDSVNVWRWDGSKYAPKETR